jgi:hypothetical protein
MGPQPRPVAWKRISTGSCPAHSFLLPGSRQSLVPTLHNPPELLAGGEAGFGEALLPLPWTGMLPWVGLETLQFSGAGATPALGGPLLLLLLEVKTESACFMEALVKRLCTNEGGDQQWA